MNIFLCGQPQVGKSTIIKTVLQELKITPSGFITFAGKRQADGYSGVYIYNADCSLLVESDSNRIGLRMGNGKFKTYPKIFETIGLDILKKIAPPLILMDELGFMENGAVNYQAKILKLLDGKVPVLGVVKPRNKETSFLKAVREHPKSHILDVDICNKNEVYEKMKSLLKELLQNRV